MVAAMSTWAIGSVITAMHPLTDRTWYCNRIPYRIIKSFATLDASADYDTDGAHLRRRTGTERQRVPAVAQHAHSCCRPGGGPSGQPVYSVHFRPADQV